MRKRLKIVILTVLFAVIVLSVGFLVYVSDYYKADEIAAAVMAEGDNLIKDGDYLIIKPSIPSETALIFYPGGKVEYIAYIPLMQRLSQEGITCVLVKMPFNLAVFNPNAADKVYNKLLQIKKWYIGGHSLGGAMASSYAVKHMEKLSGLILLGAYIYGDIPPSFALTIYGSEDEVLDKTKINYKENISIIAGGNHAYYGNYGEQAGDGDALIKRETQQDVTAMLISGFIQLKNSD